MRDRQVDKRQPREGREGKKGRPGKVWALFSSSPISVGVGPIVTFPSRSKKLHCTKARNGRAPSARLVCVLCPACASWLSKSGSCTRRTAPNEMHDDVSRECTFSQNVPASYDTIRSTNILRSFQTASVPASPAPYPKPLPSRRAERTGEGALRIQVERLLQAATARPWRCCLPLPSPPPRKAKIEIVMRLECP